MISHPEKSKDHQETNCWPRRICTSSSQSESSNLSDNADKRCQPQWGSWRRRRRRREGSQRKKGQLRRDETHKGKEGRRKGFTAGKEQMTFKRVTEYGKWARRLKGLVGGRADFENIPWSLFLHWNVFFARPKQQKHEGKAASPGWKWRNVHSKVVLTNSPPGASNLMAHPFVSTPVRWHNYLFPFLLGKRGLK